MRKWLRKAAFGGIVAMLALTVIVWISSYFYAVSVSYSAPSNNRMELYWSWGGLLCSYYENLLGPPGWHRRIYPTGPGGPPYGAGWQAHGFDWYIYQQMPIGYRETRLQVPFWFIAAVLGAILFYIRRRERQNANRPAFPVDVPK